MLDKEQIVRMTITGTTSKACIAPKEGPICTVREGSQVAIWAPDMLPAALIIIHPDDAPRMVYFDGTEETLKVGADGSILLPPVAISIPDPNITYVGTLNHIHQK